MTTIRTSLFVLLALSLALPALAHETCTVVLSGSLEVPPNDSPQLGVAQLRLTGRVLHFDIRWTGTTGDFTGAHFHYADPGENGPIVFDLGPFIEDNRAQGIWVMSNDDREDLEEGEIYINVHSTTYPGGEVRAWLDCDFDGEHGPGGDHGDRLCVVELSGEREVPPNESANLGYALLALDDNTLSFSIYWTGVTGDFSGAHFHYAAAGESGPVVFNLGPFIVGNTAIGEWEMSDDDLEDLEEGEIYVNVHSSTYPGGEIRGQVGCFTDDDDDDEDEEEECEVELSGENEVPPNESDFEGEAEFTLSEDQDTLYFEIDWSGLTGTFTGAHIHHAVEGVNGPVIFDLGPFIDGNEASGWWAIPDENLEDLMEEELYVNVHSSTYPGGEIRGQIECEFEEDDDDDGGRHDGDSKISDGAGKVSAYALHDNYPNPFNLETRITFDVKEAGLVTLSVHDILGREIAQVVKGTMEEGRHTISFDASGLPSGIYFYRLNVNDYLEQKKMMLLK